MGFATFISAMILAGLALLGWGLHAFIRGRQSLSWPATQGRILQCALEDDRDSETPTYRVTVRYAYRVDGQKFEGTRISFGYCGGTWREEHEEIYDKLKRSSQVTVRYDRAQPRNAVLKVGPHRLSTIVLVFASIWLAVTVTVAAAVWMSR